MFIANGNDPQGLAKSRKQAQANANSSGKPWVILRDTNGNYRVESSSGEGQVAVVYPEEKCSSPPQSARFTAEHEGVGKEFSDAREAVEWARGRVKLWRDITVAVIWYSTDPGKGRVVGLVTDDANGITVHRLRTWPDGVDVPG